MPDQFYRIKADENLFEFDADLPSSEDEIRLDDVFDVILREESLCTDSEKWLYLDGVEVFRSDFSGNKYSPKIKFSPCYVEVSESIKQLINQGVRKDPQIKSKYSRLNRKLRKKKSVPITCIMDCCKVAGKDFWQSIEGELVSGKSSSKKVKVPKNSPKLQEIVTWIITEGHIPLSHPSIEINQVSSSSEVLHDLADKFEEIFEVSDIANFSSTTSWSGEPGERLIISSAPVRQLLVLKYDIPLGKKSRKLNQKIEVTQNNFENLLKTFIQTEGSINRSQERVRFEFKIQDENVRDTCFVCLEKLGCKPAKAENEKTFDTGVYNYEGILRLFNFMKQKMSNREITNKTERIVIKSNILSGMKDQSWSKYVQEARKQLGNHPNKKFVEIHNRQFPENKINHNIVSTSALEKVPVRLSVAIAALQIIEKSIEQELPGYLQPYISSVEFQSHDSLQP